MMKSTPALRVSAHIPPQPDAKSVGRRLRVLRNERGWSLADVEKLSHGSIKASVLGSYERCDRAMSLERAIELAGLFSVPLTHLLCAPEQIPLSHPNARIMIDLRRLKDLPVGDQITLQFTTFVSWIAGKRSDWNGEVMSLRQGDLSTLALMTTTDELKFLAWLRENNLLIAGKGRL